MSTTPDSCRQNAAARLSSRDASRLKLLQVTTIVWMVVELIAAVALGIQARSIALTAFGADSGIELLSALVVLKAFSGGMGAEQKAARISAYLLYALAAYIAITSTISLVLHSFQTRPSYPGIVLLFVAGLLMPLLGRAKRKLAVKTGNAAFKADAAQSTMCAYMSWIALAGLGVNAALHVTWADSIAALALLPLVLKEANEAREGKSCTC